MTENSLVDNAKRMELLKLTDDSQNNNYGKWKSKVFHTMCGWDLWQYIEGPTSTLLRLTAYSVAAEPYS